PSIIGDREAKIVAEGFGITFRNKVFELVIWTHPAIANLILPLRRCLVVPCSAVVGVLCLLCRVVRDTKQQNSVRLSRRNRKMAHRETNIVRRIRVPSKVAYVRGAVEGIIRQFVAAVEASEGTVV